MVELWRAFTSHGAKFCGELTSILDVLQTMKIGGNQLIKYETQELTMKIDFFVAFYFARIRHRFPASKIST